MSKAAAVNQFFPTYAGNLLGFVRQLADKKLPRIQAKPPLEWLSGRKKLSLQLVNK